MMWLLLSRVFAGLLLGGVIGALVTGDWIYTIVWTVALTGFLFFAVVGGSRRRQAPPPGLAIARVESVTRTGRERDGRQEISVRVTVAPEGESPYQTSALTHVLADDLRFYTPGALLAATRVGQDRPDVTLSSVIPAALHARAAQVRADPSLIPPVSSVPAWETATTTTPGTRRPGSRRVGGGAQRLVAIALILAVATVTTIPAWGSIARAAQSFAVGDWDGTNLITGNYQQEAVDAVAQVVGGYEFTRATFYDTYLIIDAPTTAGADTTDTFMYRYGRAWREGPEFIQPSDVDAERFDASGLDFGQVAAAVELTKQTTDLTNPSFFASVTREADFGPVITVSVSGDYGSMTYQYGFDLELLRSF